MPRRPGLVEQLVVDQVDLTQVRGRRITPDPGQVLDRGPRVRIAVDPEPFDGGQIGRVEQLVELGGVLARSAKIEAAYGGGFSPALMQVSTDFAEVIAQIKRSLEVLGKERLVKD